MKKFLVYLLALIALPCSLLLAAVDDSYGGTATSTSGASAVDVLSLATLETLAGTTCLIGVLNTSGTTTALTMVWDSAGSAQSMTLRGAQTNTFRQQAFGLTNASVAVGTLNLLADWTTNSRTATLGAVAFKGTDTTECLGDLSGGLTTFVSTGTSTTASITGVTSAAGDATVGVCQSNTNFSATVDGVEIGINNAGTQKWAASYTLGGTSNSHSFTLLSGLWQCMGFHVLAGASSGGVRIIGGGVFQ